MHVTPANVTKLTLSKTKILNICKINNYHDYSQQEAEKMANLDILRGT